MDKYNTNLEKKIKEKLNNLEDFTTKELREIVEVCFQCISVLNN